MLFYNRLNGKRHVSHVHLSENTFQISPSRFVLGMFGTAVSSSRPGVASSLDQGDFVAKPPTDPSGGIYSHTLSGSHLDGDDSPRPDEVKVSHTSSSVKSYVCHTKFPVTKVPSGVFSTTACAAEGEECKV